MLIPLTLPWHESSAHPTVAEGKLALVIELKAVKGDFAAFREKASADREMMEAAFDSSGDTLLIMAMVVALLCTTFVGASQKSGGHAEPPQFHLLRISLLIPAAPKAYWLLLLLWIL